MNGVLLFTAVTRDDAHFASLDCARVAQPALCDDLVGRLAALAAFAEHGWRSDAVAVEDALCATASAELPSWLGAISPASAMARIQLVSREVRQQPITLLATCGADPVWGELTLHDESVRFEVLTVEQLRARIRSLVLTSAPDTRDARDARDAVS